MDQRKKGIKPPFLRNNYQGKPASKKPRMIEEIWKIPRKPPIECWGCGGDNVLRYCPHKGEKVNTSYNV
jgi:hypothetical protein